MQSNFTRRLSWLGILALPLSFFTLALAAPDSRPATSPVRSGSRPATVKVAAIQCSSDLGEVEANRAKLTALVEQAARQGAKIIVLPEAAVTGYLSQDLKTNWQVPGRPIENVFTGKDPAGFAEPVPGPSTRHFGALAKKLGVYITVPLVEVAQAFSLCPSSQESQAKSLCHTVEVAQAFSLCPSSQESQAKSLCHTAPAQPVYYNTVCLVGPTGEIVAHYRKLTPWPYPEKSWATPGDRGVQTYDTEYGRVGLAICYDIHTILEKYEPEHLWALLYPIAWVDQDHPADWFFHQLPPRIAAAKFYLVGANWSVDEPQTWRGYGFSEILAPDGEILASSHKLYGSDIIYATIPTAPR